MNSVGVLDLNYIFTNEFDEESFREFTINLVNLEQQDLLNCKEVRNNSELYKTHIEYIKDIGKYKDEKNKTILISMIKLKESPEKARTMQRNFIAKYIKLLNVDAALVGLYSENTNLWRISFVKLDYTFDVEGLKEIITPAKRYSYLIEPYLKNHTAQEQLGKLFYNDDKKPSEDEIEEVFSVQSVTDDFFNMYKNKYLDLKELLERCSNFVEEGKRLEIKTEYFSEEFAKKLMGQIAFLYFLQKKGWLGVKIVPKKIEVSELRKLYKEQNEQTREIIYRVYKSKDNFMYLSNHHLVKLDKEEGELLASVFKNTKYDEEWGSGTRSFIRTIYNKAEKNEFNFFNKYLEPLFYNALNKRRGSTEYYNLFNCKIPFLNGGLFEPIYNYKWKDINIQISNEFFSNEDESGLLDLFDMYNFTINEDEPLEKEVAVDPEMLGKIFENLLEIKERKSKGAFYTPREIVHYMCQESLINYLVNKTNIDEKSIELFIRYGDIIKDEDSNIENYNDYRMPKTILNNIKQIDDALATVTVADPAAGSGAFPLGMLSEIVKLRNIITQYMIIEMDDFNKRELVEKRSVYILKRNTMKKSIFAVDIEPSAIDIAKLRLWLSLVVDAEVKTVNTLPNLDYNIMVGNSLIDEYEGIKLFDEELLKEKVKRKKKSISNQIQMNINNTDVKIGVEQEQHILEDIQILQSKLFDIKVTSEKLKIKEEIEKKEWELIEYKLSKENKRKELQSLEKTRHENRRPYFLWKLEFSKIFRDNNGFDIVIGNPPYIGERNNSDIFQQLKISKEWKLYCTKRMNIYYCFAKKGIDILKESGVLLYIIPYEWMTADSAKNMRKYLLQNSKINKIIHFADNYIFEGVGTSSMILKTVKTQNIENNKFKFTIYDGKKTKVKNIFSQSNTTENKKQSNLDVTGKRIWSLACKEKFINNSKIVTLGEILNVQVGIQTGANKVMKSHIDDGLVNKEQVGRGIFELREGIDIIRKDDKFFINLSDNNNNNFIELSKEESLYIKPVYSGCDLNKWNKEPNKSWIINIYDTNLQESSNIYKYLYKYKKILINRSLKKNQDIVECDEFDKFTIDDIKRIYSPAGSVQKVMRKKQWYSIMFARENINFKSPKIMTSSRTQSFTYSQDEAYGLSGINYIFFDNKVGCNYKKIIDKYTTEKDFLKYVNALLNSEYMKHKLTDIKLNALTGSKLKQIIKIYKIDFEDEVDKHKYNLILEKVNLLIDLYKEEKYNDKELIESEINKIILELYNC